MTSTPEITLDPENWDEMKKLGHQIVDDLIEMLKTDREHEQVESSLKERIRQLEEETENLRAQVSSGASYSSNSYGHERETPDSGNQITVTETALFGEEPVKLNDTDKAETSPPPEEDTEPEPKSVDPK